MGFFENPNDTLVMTEPQITVFILIPIFLHKVTYQKYRVHTTVGYRVVLQLDLTKLCKFWEKFVSF